MADDELLYELDEWEDHERDALSEALAAEAVPYAWEGTTLVVRTSDEATVERVLDAVDEALDLELSPDEPHVAYDLTEWDDDRRVELDAALSDAGIPHAWSGDELLVHETDEQIVDDLLDHSGAGADGDVGEAAGAELLGELFVAADRLLHDPRDHEGTLSLIDSVRMARSMQRPFGIDDREWGTITGCAHSLASLVERSNVDDDAVITAATELRRMLRPLV